MYSLGDLITIVLGMFIGSLIIALTKGDRENIGIKVILGTIIGTIMVVVFLIFG